MQCTLLAKMGCVRRACRCLHWAGQSVSCFLYLAPQIVKRVGPHHARASFNRGTDHGGFAGDGDVRVWRRLCRFEVDKYFNNTKLAG